MGSGVSHPQLLSSAPRVVIVGGGFGGVETARILDETGQFNVLLIDKKNYFFNNCAMVRAPVEDGFAPKLFVPYTKLFKHGAFIHAEVVEIGRDFVRIQGYDSPITFDYLVIGLGSTSGFPSKVWYSQRHTAVQKFAGLLSSVRAAKSVTIIGAGITGVEIAGEIATDFPEKKVRLLHSRDDILEPQLKDELKDKVSEILQRLKVEVVLNEKALLTDAQKQILATGQVLHAKDSTPIVLRTEKGNEFHQDLVLPSIGLTIANNPLHAHFADCLNEEGRLKINKFNQVEGTNGKVFAVGDIAGSANKMAYYAVQQGGTVAKNIQQLQAGQSSALQEWKAIDQAVAFISLGRKSGYGQYGNLLFGEWIVWAFKSRHLRVTAPWGGLNITEADFQKKDHENNELGESLEDVNVRVKNLQAFLQVDDKTAEAILRHGLAAVTASAGSN